MAELTQPRRTASLKRALATNKSRYIDYTSETRTERRPSKPTFFQFHITNEDIVRNTTTTASRTPQQGRRETWPASAKKAAPRNYDYDVPPTLVRTPWELDRSKRSGSSHGTQPRPSTSQKFQALPREIIVHILEQLKSVHCSDNAIQLKNYQRDLRVLCVLNKRWNRVAQEHLYREVWLPGNEEPNRSAVPFRKRASALQLFLRTLSESTSVPYMVHHLRVTTKLADELEFEALSTRQVSKDSTIRIFEETIRRCPNLEHLSGYAPMVLESNDGLFEALSSCHRLKSHTWRLAPVQQRAHSPNVLKYHNAAKWQHLETLLIWQAIGTCSVGVGTINALTQRLPALKHLTLRGIPPTDFHNGTLLTLPALKSLRLEELHGITDQGIEQLVHSRVAMSLERLVLSGLELTSLQSLQTLFANLPRLSSFSMLQNTSPEIPPLLSAITSNFSLASTSMRYLHWNVLAPGNSTLVIANSIAAGKFPNLRTVKIACDDDGAVQGLCRPIALQPVTGQDTAMLEEWELSSSYKRSLRISQIQAQLRVRKERQQPSLRVVIQDEDETTQHTHVIGSYLGNMASYVEYSLQPAIQGTGSAIAGVEDIFFIGKADRSWALRKGEEQLLDLDALF